jgi:serine/threonine-protein kinase
MSAGDWQEVRGLVQEALDLPTEERRAFLAAACASDEQRRQVEDLLAAERAAGELFELPALGDAWEPGDVPRVGCYRLLRELGRGGMSTVYLARRDDEAFEKRVAVKVLREDVRSDDLLRRFHTERQILADLDHPFIARLLDGGQTAAGRPYLVMEYVEGEPIDAYCDRRGLGVDERVELFRSVCAAVQYAHQNLVVHRDLKPSNVLVTADGTPKLLDFGIAKLLGSDPAGGLRADVTQTWHRVLTPQYASPEQVKGEPITTASDVYSLGVVLYELLSGRLPYRFERRTPTEIERLVCEQEPPWPSAAVEGSAPIRRRLEGDLDHIVMKALRKEPGARYPTVDQLSEDLRRYRVGAPVTARQGNVLYRTGKFLRRHRVGVGVAAAFLVLVLGFAATTAVQSRRILEERDRALQERAAVMLARQRAEEVSSFLVALFELSDPAKKLDRAVTARELLDRGAARIADELRGQPQLQAELMRTMAEVYEGQGLDAKAEALLRDALDIQRPSLRENDFCAQRHQVAKTLHALAGVLLSKGEHEDAENTQREALASYHELFPAGSAELGTALNRMGSILRLRSDYPAAERFLRDGLAMLRASPEPDEEDVADGLRQLAYVLYLRSGYAESADAYRQAIALRRELFGDQHPELAPLLSDFALLLNRMHLYEEALGIQQRALAIYQRHFGDEHPDVATLDNNLAGTLVELGRYEEAEGYARKSLALDRRLRGRDYFGSGAALLTLARIRFLQGDLDGAEPYYRQALKVIHRTLGDRHPHGAHPLLWLGRVELARGRPAKAEPLLRQALDIWRATLPEGHLFIARTEGALGACLAARGKPAEGRALLERSHRLLAAQIGEDAEFTRWVRVRLDELPSSSAGAAGKAVADGERGDGELAPS